MTSAKVVFGVRSVLEALRGQKVERVYLARSPGGQTQHIRAVAHASGVQVVEASKEDLQRRAGNDHHQGVVALLDVSTHREWELDEMIDAAVDTNRPPLLLLLDGVQDPHNLGAILRSAFAFGVHGVVIPKNRAVSVNATVVRASAGAALHVPVGRVVNLKHALTRLKDRGVWTFAAEMSGRPASGVDLRGPVAIVLGGEGGGVRKTLAASCDDRISIPMLGNFDSLNVSVAAGILLYEISRQRVDPKA